MNGQCVHGLLLFPSMFGASKCRVERNDETGEVRDEPIGWFHFWMIFKSTLQGFPGGDFEPKSTGHSVPWRQYGAEGWEPVLQLAGGEWIGLGEMCECVIHHIYHIYIHIHSIYILGVAKTLGLQWVAWCRRWACQASGLRMGAAQCQGYLGAVGKVGYVFKGMAYWLISWKSVGNRMSFPRNYADTSDSTMKFDVPDICESGGSLPPRHVGYPSEVQGHAIMHPKKAGPWTYRL